MVPVGNPNPPIITELHAGSLWAFVNANNNGNKYNMIYIFGLRVGCKGKFCFVFLLLHLKVFLFSYHSIICLTKYITQHYKQVNEW